MPGLMVQTSPSASSQVPPAHSPQSPKSRYSSPQRPPHSPITPVLEPARLASNSSQNALPPTSQTYTHSTQQVQTAIPRPPPQVIDFESNPDAIALKATISILQVQRRNAEDDIKQLHQTKQRAVADTEGFIDALTSGKLKSKSRSLFEPTGSDSEDEVVKDVLKPGSEVDEDSLKQSSKPWPAMPTLQNVARQPPINWNQYGVVGDSLDKLHADQKSRPTEGMPQRPAADGTFVFGGDGPRRQANLGIAAPYNPSKDRIEKTKKSGKR